ncbi:hypothetical protein JCM19376_41060 [Fusibacter bizertensis]
MAKSFSGLDSFELPTSFFNNLHSIYQYLEYLIVNATKLDHENDLFSYQSDLSSLLVNLQMNTILIIRLTYNIIILLNSEVIMDVSYYYKRIQRASAPEK